MTQRISKEMIPQGTPSYLAPEVVQAWFSPQKTHPFTDRIDIFSLGAMAVVIAINKYPFRRLTRRLQDAHSLSVRELAEQFQLPSTKLSELDTISPTLSRLVAFCLQQDPQRRPSARQLLDQLLASGSPSAKSSPKTSK
jgi:serine/threonine protein kinase